MTQKTLTNFGLNNPLNLPIIKKYYINGGMKNMTTIREAAKDYESKLIKNISELDKVSTELNIEERSFTDRDGDEFKVSVTTINGEEYRVPRSVIKQLKVVLEASPQTTKFKVMKSGEGLSTVYMVVPLD